MEPRGSRFLDPMKASQKWLLIGRPSERALRIPMLLSHAGVEIVGTFPSSPLEISLSCHRGTVVEAELAAFGLQNLLSFDFQSPHVDAKGHKSPCWALAQQAFPRAGSRSGSARGCSFHRSPAPGAPQHRDPQITSKSQEMQRNQTMKKQQLYIISI